MTHNLLADLDRERNAAGEIKRDKPILVVIGNPPYNGYAGIGINEERDLSNAYRRSAGTRQPQGQGLNDLYVRFFRMAERRIVEQTGQGVVCYISNYSWLDGLSFPAMRERYLNVFDQIWIDNLHGDRIISEYAPDGRTSETVFAVDQQSPGIRIGTAISTLVARGTQNHNLAEVLYRDMDQARAKERTAALNDSLRAEDFSTLYQTLDPVAALGYPFKPRIVASAYLTWPLLTELFPISFPGIKTSRDEVVVDIDRARLIERMEMYFDPARSDAEVTRLIPGSMDSTASFNATVVRQQLLARGFLPDNIIRYTYRPFDVRWLYWEPETNLLDRNRAEYLPHVRPGNTWFSVTQRNRRSDFYHPLVSSIPIDLNASDGSVRAIPTYTYHKSTGPQEADGLRNPNLSKLATGYLETVTNSVDELFYHSLATIFSPFYVNINRDPLMLDFARIPLPTDAEALAVSASLGRVLAALLDIEQDVDGVSSSSIRSELRPIASLQKVGGGAINPDTNDLLVNAGWGSHGSGSSVRPGRGRYVRHPVSSASSTIFDGQTVDVYLNDSVYWQNVPEQVWEYTLGGYQVLKKWLSYRETAILGRSLKAEEARTFSQIARRIAAILLMEDDLDASYQCCAANTWDWQAAVAASKTQRPLFGDLDALNR